ncbi:MAG TPA: response regulator [Polyangia bacterium]|nr:response regulator [Polyangia bacterium]
MAAAVAAGKRNVAIVEREPPKRVVIVDDDRDTRERLQEILEKSGWSVALAPSGLRLLSLLEVDRPDIILLDIAMSWINGFELCRAMKANQNYANIPVVFISGRSAPSDIENGLSCGAADYFVKPIDTQRLLSRLRELSP